MPLYFAKSGEINQIKKIGGKEEIKRFLEKLGFIVGEKITVVSENRGNVIVMLKESRVAISSEMASKIFIERIVG